MSMNMHEAGIYETAGQTDKQKQAEGESRKHVVKKQIPWKH